MSTTDVIAGIGNALKLLVKPLTVAIVLALIFLVVRWFGLFSSPITSTRLTGTAAKAPEGVLYQLPLTVIDIDVQAKLNGCRVVRVPAGGDSQVPNMVVDFLLQPTINIRTTTDPGAIYVLDGKNLGAALFSSDVMVELSGGIITSISAQSASLGVQAPALPETIKIVQGIQVAPVATAVSSADLGVSDARACGPLIYSLLSRRAELNEQIKKPPSPDLLEVLKADLAAADKALSRETRLSLIPRRSESGISKVKIDPSLMFVGLGDNLREYLRKQTVDVAVLAGEVSSKADLPAKTDGLVYRNAATATLVLCQNDCTLDDSKRLAPTTRIHTLPRAIQVAQLGIDAVMPVERNLFSKSAVALTFTADGILSKVSTSDKPMPPNGIVVAPATK